MRSDRSGYKEISRYLNKNRRPVDPDRLFYSGCYLFFRLFLRRFAEEVFYLFDGIVYDDESHQ